MINLVIFGAMIGCLYGLHRAIQRRLMFVILLLKGSPQNGIVAYAWLFLPGILIHEITHFLTASMLGVRTGEITLLPSLKPEIDNRVTLGSVKIAKTDFLRESLIGAAPFLIGCGVIFYLVSRTFVGTDQSRTLTLLNLWHTVTTQLGWQLVLVIYLILSISNTMFVSREDTRAWPVLGVLGGLIVAGLGFFHYLGVLGEWLGPVIISITQALAVSFFLVNLIDLTFWGFLYLWQKILEAMTHRRIREA